MIPLQKCKKEKEEKERTQGLVNCVRGTITITRAWDVCVDGEATQHLAKEYEMGSYKPKKVNFCLSNMEYRDLKWKLDDGYVHFLRLGLWIQYFREELAVRDQAGRCLCIPMPDFIALKEVFVDLFLTPYCRSSHLWRSSRTIARSPEKLSPKAAFTAHLMGLHTPGHGEADTSGKKRVVPFPGQHWQVYWGEVEGLGLLYSSLVDLTDRSARVTRRAMARHPQLAGVLREVVSERHFMYRTHLYQAPQDTQAWRDAMWFTFLEWWADYQFGRLPTIIGGEMTGQQVMAIRLFCAQTLPQLAQAWCDRPAWDTGLGEQYLSSLLRFIKYWCNKRPRETLSFELQENGDVLCCKRRFKIASQHFLVNSILPDEFVRDVYPAPPPQPKPSWPGKRGRKSKPRVTPQPTRPRRVTCHWKLPRYCDVETEPPTSPPRYVFRPEMKDPQNPHNVKQSDTCGFFTDAGWGLGERGKTQRPARHTRFKDKEPNKESDTFGLFTDAGWGLGEQRETHRTARHTRSSRGARHCSQARQHSQHSQSRHSLQNCDPRRLTEGLTRAQVSREVDKRAREWYKSTVPSLSLPKSFIAENRDEGRQRLSDSESEDTITSRRNEMLFAPLPVQELKAAAGRQREERHSREREAVSEEEV
ncbi:hypothetical protein O3P69_004735 [Scylla paramamosain]|uniref:Aminotransferase-like plant mobile domain-containing protein n=1 Tax=Scylla paramamosain TaxID=85552 RepID=A0AAW0UGC1_SCYPA